MPQAHWESNSTSSATFSRISWNGFAAFFEDNVRPELSWSAALSCTRAGPEFTNDPGWNTVRRRRDSGSRAILKKIQADGVATSSWTFSSQHVRGPQRWRPVSNMQLVFREPFLRQRAWNPSRRRLAAAVSHVVCSPYISLLETNASRILTFFILGMLA